MAEIKDTVVKKQVQQQSTSATTKPKVETKNKDIAVFGKLSTANKTTEKASSETLANRLSGAQGEKPQAEAKEVKRDDAQVSVSAFGSLTGIKQEKTQAKDNASIFNRLDSAQSAQGVTNPVNASDVASTKEALAQEKGSTGSNFDSDNFAAFNDDAPNAENCGSNNQAMIQKRRVDQYGGYLTGQIPGYTNVTKPNVHRNNVIDVVNRYNTGTTRSPFQRQIEYDYRDAMGLQLSVPGGSGCGSTGSTSGSGCGCGGTSSGSGCSGTSSSSSSHHKKHKGVSTGAAIAIGLGAGLGGLALGGLAAWGISKACSSGAEAAKGGAGTTNNIASVGGSVGSAASAAGNGVKSAASATAEAAKISGKQDIANNTDVSGVLSNNDSAISQLKSATPENYIDALAKADVQYDQDTSAIGAVSEEISTLSTQQGENEANLASVSEMEQTSDQACQTLNQEVNTNQKRKEQSDAVGKQYRAKEQEYGENIDKNTSEISTLEQTIKDKKAKVTQLNTQLNGTGATTDSSVRSKLNEQIKEAEKEQHAAEEKKKKLEQENENYKKMKTDAATQAQQAEDASKELETMINNDKQESEKYKKLKTDLNTKHDQLALAKNQLKAKVDTGRENLNNTVEKQQNLIDAREDLVKQMNSTYQDAKDRKWYNSTRLFSENGGDAYNIGTARTLQKNLNSSDVVGSLTGTAAANATPTGNTTGSTPTANATTPEAATTGANLTPAAGGESAPGAEAANNTIKSENGEVLTWNGDCLLDGKGSPFTGTADDGLYYDNGSVANGVAENGKFYEDGTPCAGVSSEGVHYGKNGQMIKNALDGDVYCGDDGKPGTGLFNDTYYANGKLGTGEYNDLYYKDGKLGSGFSEDGATLYQDGVDVSNSAMVDAIVNDVRANTTGPNAPVDIKDLGNDYHINNSMASLYSQYGDTSKWLDAHRKEIEAKLNSEK